MGKFAIDTSSCRFCCAPSNESKLMNLQDPNTMFAKQFCSIIRVAKASAINFAKDRKYLVCFKCLQMALDIYEVKRREYHIGKELNNQNNGMKEKQICSGDIAGQASSSTASNLSLKVSSSDKCASQKTKLNQTSHTKANKKKYGKYHKSVVMIQKHYPGVILPHGIEQYDWDPIITLDSKIMSNYFGGCRQSQVHQGEYVYRSNMYRMKDVPINVPPNEDEHKMLLFSSLHLMRTTESNNNLLQLVNIPKKVNSETFDHTYCDKSIVDLDIEEKLNKSEDDLNTSLLEVLRSEDVHICKLCCRVFATVAGLRRHKTSHENWKRRSTNFKILSKEIVVPLTKMEKDTKIIHNWPTAVNQLFNLISKKEETDITEENNFTEEASSLKLKHANDTVCREIVKSAHSTERNDIGLNKCEKCVTTVKHNVIFKNFSAHTCLCKPKEKCTEVISPELDPYSPMSVQFSVTDCNDLCYEHGEDNDDNDDVVNPNECALKSALCVNSSKSELSDEALYLFPLLKKVKVKDVSIMYVDMQTQTKDLQNISYFSITLNDKKDKAIINNLASHLEIFSHITVAATENNVLGMAVTISYMPGDNIPETFIDITSWIPITFDYFPCRTITRNGQMYDIQEIRKMKIKTNSGQVADVISLEIGH